MEFWSQGIKGSYAHRHCAGHFIIPGLCLPRIQKLNGSKFLVVAESPCSGPDFATWFPSEQLSCLAVE